MPPIPRILETAQGSGQFIAQGVAPVQDATGQQLQRAGRAVQQAGFTMTALAEREIETINLGRVKEADNLLQDAYRRRLSGSDGYRSKLGKAAVDGREEVLRGIEEDGREIGEKLETAEQREAFDAVRRQRAQRAMQAVDSHHAQQASAYAQAETLASIQAHGADYLNQIGNPQAMAASMAELQSDVTALLDEMGAGPKQRKQVMREHLSKLHAQAVGSLVDQDNPSGARAYLAQHGSDMDPKTRDHSRALVKRGSIAHDSTNLALQLLAEPVRDIDTSAIEGLPGTDEFRISEAEAIRIREDQRQMQLQDAYDKLDDMFARGNISAEVRDATRARIAQQERQEQANVAEFRQSVMADSERWLSENPLSGIDALPPHLFTQLQVHGLLGDLAGFADGRRYTTDPEAAARLLAVPDDQLRQMSPQEVYVMGRGKLNNQDLRYLQARHAKAIGQATPEIRRVITVQDRVKRTARQLGILPRGSRRMSGAEQERWEQFQFRFNEDLERWQRTNGREAGDDDIQKMLDLMVEDEVFEVGSLWDSAPRPLVTFGDDVEDVAVAVQGETVMLRDIPAPVKQTIGNYLRERGIPATSQQVANWWIAAGRPTQ